MSKIIRIECKGADLVSLDELEDFQGNLKKITKVNLNRLKKRIIKSFDAPIYVWVKPDKSKKILDGHQRRKALLELRNEGYAIPKIPIDYIYAEDEKQAREKLLGITSSYGEFEFEELDEWLAEVDKDSFESIRLTDNELKIKEVDFDDAEKEKQIKKIKCPKCGFEIIT